MKITDITNITAITKRFKNTGVPFKSDLTFDFSTRESLTLVDSISADNAAIVGGIVGVFDGGARYVLNESITKEDLEEFYIEFWTNCDTSQYNTILGDLYTGSNYSKINFNSNLLYLSRATNGTITYFPIPEEYRTGHHHYRLDYFENGDIKLTIDEVYSQTKATSGAKQVFWVIGSWAKDSNLNNLNGYLSNVNINGTIYHLNGHTYDSISGVEATNNGVTFANVTDYTPASTLEALDSGYYQLSTGEKVINPQFALPAGATAFEGGKLHNFVDSYVQMPSDYNNLITVSYNSETGLLEDLQGNMTPVFNQVAVFEFQGTDRIVLNNPVAWNVGESLVMYMDFSTATILTRYFIGFTQTGGGIRYNSADGFLIFLANNYTILNWTKVNGLKTFKFTRKTSRLYDLFIDDSYIGELDHGDYTGDITIDEIGARDNAVFHTGIVPRIEFPNGTILNLQHFSGNKVYSTDGSITGTISGSGSWWTTADAIPDYNQLGCKKAILNSGATFGLFPLAISDAQLTSDLVAAGYTVDSITNFVRTSDTEIFDTGVTVDLHPTVSDLVVSLGNELVFNGGFDGSSVGWTNGTGWTYGNNNIIATEATGNLEQQLLESAYKLYRISIDVISYTSGTFRIELGGSTFNQFINSSVIVYFYAGGVTSATFKLKPLTFTGIIDNISVKEITTLSDHINNIQTANPSIDLNAVVPGQPLPSDFYYDLDPDKSTINISLENPNEPTKFYIFDKSNTDIYAQIARDSEYYDSSNPHLWHISELNYDTWQSYLNTAYKERNFTGIKTNYGNQLEIFRILSYATQKSGQDLIDVLDYINYNYLPAGYAYLLDSEGNKTYDSNGSVLTTPI